MISIKGHIKILRDGMEPLDLTEYSRDRGFPEMTFSSWEAFVEDMKRREADAIGGEAEVQVAV